MFFECAARSTNLVGSTHVEGICESCNHRVLLVNFEMENIRDLEIRAIDQDQIATDNDVRVIRRRRREHHFEFPRAGLHLFLEARRQSSTNH